MVCLWWFVCVWFDEVLMKLLLRFTRRDALNAVAVFDGVTRVLEKYFVSDGDCNVMDGLEKYVVVIVEMFCFIVFDDVIDDYFDKDVLGERSLFGAIELICCIMCLVLFLYMKSVLGDVNELLVIMLVYLLEIVELFMVDINVYEDIGIFFRVDIVVIFSMSRVKFI